jgi:hypothetical protein
MSLETPSGFQPPSAASGSAPDDMAIDLSPLISPRKIGDTVVPAIGLGVMGIAAAYGTFDTDEERLQVGFKLFFRIFSTHSFYRFLMLHTELGVHFGILPMSMGIQKISLANG